MIKNLNSKKTSNSKNLVIIKHQICHLHKDIYNNLKHETDFIIKHNRFLAEQTIKNNMKLLFNYNHGKDTHEHRKQ